jgi:DASH complex subunit DAD3
MLDWQRQSRGYVSLSKVWITSYAHCPFLLCLSSLWRQVTALSLSLSSNERHASLLTDLRILERKMGLVLTLFKASVWSLIQTHQDEMEEQQQRQQQQEENAEYSNYRADDDGTILQQDYAY